MPLNWIDVTDLSFNTLLLLEREQLAWLEGWLPEPELAAALKANPAEEHAEMERVAKSGGMVILRPGNNDRDEGRQQFLVDQGFSWSRFEEPGDGIKRKYWKTV